MTRPVGRGFQISIELQLPRDRMSVPLARHLLRAAMGELGVMSDDSEAVQLALSEACTNVIAHAGPGDAYEVRITVTPRACELRVFDEGRGFEQSADPTMPQRGAVRGRGLALMQAIVDQVSFTSRPEVGTVVSLVKELRFDESAPGRRLSLASEAGERSG